jgi:hypothetical protein
LDGYETVERKQSAEDLDFNHTEKFIIPPPLLA